MRLRTLLAALMTTALLLSVAPANGAEIEVLVSFDAGAGELPEGVAVDKRGNIFVSLINPVSEIRKIAPDGTLTTLVDLGFETGNGPLGLAVDALGTVHAAAATFDPATQGVYAIAPDGTAVRLSGTGQISFPNGLAFDHRGTLYVTDSSFGAVWRIPRGGSAELWIQDPLLEGTGELGAGVPIGANGITFRGPDEIVVGNTERGTLVSVPILPNGDAGEPVVIADDDAIFGVDGLTVDVHGAIYAAVIAQSTIVRVDGDTIETLATADDGLNQASSIVFGQGIRDRMSLFGVNFGIFSPEPTPSLFQLPVGVPGAPAP
jgi:sugar lactone lactonase YvrE